MTKTININDHVAVKLSAKALSSLIGQTTLAGPSGNIITPGTEYVEKVHPARPDGKRLFQLHELMRYFGFMLFIGNPEPPFGTELELVDEPETNSTQPLMFVYSNYRGEISTRQVEPIKLWFGKTEWHPIPQWFLKAFDLEKKATRDFAMKDIVTGPITNMPKTVKEHAIVQESLDKAKAEHERYNITHIEIKHEDATSIIERQLQDLTRRVTVLEQKSVDAHRTHRTALDEFLSSFVKPDDDPPYKEYTDVPNEILAVARQAYDHPVREDGSSLVSLINTNYEDDVMVAISNGIAMALTKANRKD